MLIQRALLGRTLAIFCLIAAITSCTSARTKGGAETPAVPSGNAFVFVEAKPLAERRALSAQEESLLKAGKYIELDNLASDLRRKKTMFPGGRWHLDRFYDFLALSDKAPDHEWKDRIAKLENWIKARPNSITPRLALATTMTDYAWKGRTSDWGANVQEAQWKMFRERLAKAHEILLAADKLPEKCPCWYSMMLTIALGQGWSRTEVDRLFDESIKKDPKYLTVYMHKLIILLPRWGGAEGEWQAFLKDSADKLGGVEGDKLYARVLWDEEGLIGDEYVDEFRAGRLSWDRVKNGFKGLMSDYPDDLGPPSQLCAWSVKFKDRPQAKELFQKLDNRVVLGIWHTSDKFKQSRDWAYGSD